MVTSTTARPAVSRPTTREVEVLKLIAAGLSTKEIAIALKITFKTAACHRARLMDKLGIHEVAGLTRYAIRNRIVEVAPETRAGQQLEELARQVYLTYHSYQLIVGDESTGPDSKAGTPQVREAESAASEKYLAALFAVKNFLIPENS